MKIKLFIVTAFCIFSISSFAQVKVNKKQTSQKSQLKLCEFCQGDGRSHFYKICENCMNWSQEYRSKVACHVCKDQRRVLPKKCQFCNGTGKTSMTIKETFDELDKEIEKERLKSKKGNN